MSTNSLLGRTFVLLTGHLSVVVLQGLQFIFLARLLGAEEFGRVAAITALVTIAAPLSGLGYGNVMLMHVSRNTALAPTYYANAVSTALGMGAVLVGILMRASTRVAAATQELQPWSLLNSFLVDLAKTARHEPRALLLGTQRSLSTLHVT